MDQNTKPVLSVRAALQGLLAALRANTGTINGIVDARDLAEAALAAPFGLTVEQEPKYTVNDFGKLVNRSTGAVIPDDEPVMNFRAQDALARQIVGRYCDLLPENCARGTGFRDSAFERAQAFNTFAQQHSERMKKPD